MLVKVHKINAFAKTNKGGNPAGVVINADNLTEVEMKKISQLIGFSETAFVMKSKVADFKVRFFTPVEEVDLCGHATIGTFYTMATEGYIKPGIYTQETKAGILEVKVSADLSIMMKQNTPTFFDEIKKDEIADSLNIRLEDLNDSLPIQIVSTGLRDIIVPIKNIEILNSIQPNFSKISKLSKKYNVVGCHLFTLDDTNCVNAHCRNMAPLYGIDEESATGTSNGALACYLHRYNIVDGGMIVFEQGNSMDKPSEILVDLLVIDDKISEVRVGGKSMNLCVTEIDI